MDKQQLSASLKFNKGRVNLSLEVYLFQEDGIDIAYCPALDISAVGDSVDNAKEEFEQILAEHLEWCVENDTLEADLINHGWKPKGQRNNYLAPKTTNMLIGNELLRDVVDNKDYSKILLPLMFNFKRAYA